VNVSCLFSVIYRWGKKRTGVSSGLLLSGSPVTSSMPGTLGAEYVVLYTLPEGR
jgi:hypothetical protein